MKIDLRKTLFIFPNLFTVSSVVCGVFALLTCLGSPSEQDYYRAALLIVYAMFFDTIDGRVARLTKTQSTFGLQLDSLADLLSFGVAPAILVYGWTMSDAGALGVFGCTAFVVAGAIRLARFNVVSAVDGGPGKYVLGLPIPGAAGVLVSVVVANHALGGIPAISPIPIVALVCALSVLMVSSFEFRTLKDLRMTWRTLAMVTVAMSASIVMALRWHISIAFFWLICSYVAIGVVETVVRFSRRSIERARAIDIELEEMDIEEESSTEPLSNHPSASE